MPSTLIRNRFAEELLPIIMQQAEGAAKAAGAGAGGANPKNKCPIDTATAQRQAEFSADVYNDTGAPKDAIRLKNYDHPDSGFFAATYKDLRTGNIVLAYRGTEKTSIKDWWANAKQGLGFETAQYNQAAETAYEVKSLFPNENITVTGHSLGGGLAGVGAAVLGVPTTTFNAAGVNPATLARLNLHRSDLNNLITNYRVEGEVLTGFQKHPSAYVGAIGALVGALTGGGGGANLGARVGAAVGSGIPAAAGCQVDLPALHPNGEPLSSNPATRHGMDSVSDALEHQRQQEIPGVGGCF